METEILALLIPIFGIVFGNAFAFGVIYIAIRTKYKERMALIERGATAQEIYASRRISKHTALKNGLFIIGVALGLIIAAIISSLTSINPVTAYFAFTLLFGGLGLVVFYVIYSRYERSNPGSDF